MATEQVTLNQWSAAELVRRLREDYCPSYESRPTAVEIDALAAVATGDEYAPVEALSVLLKLNATYRDGWHASALIASVVHHQSMRYYLHPAYVPAAADVLLLMRENGLTQKQAVEALGGQV